MNKIFLSLVFLLGSLFSYSQSFELLDGDTINKKDLSNKRQGKWIIKASSKYPDYKNGVKVEEGNYENGRKVGLWKKWYPNGQVKSEITYKGSRPYGLYTLYYENGNVEEKGNWQRTKNTGEFKRFHSNGKLAQEFTFNESGKRDGKQKYFYENGQLRLEGSWTGGLESGEMKEYYENGDLMSAKQFNNGEMDKSSFESYAQKTPSKPSSNTGKDIKIVADKAETTNIGSFTGNGYHKLYNSNKQIAKDGEFKNYRLMDGKLYKYNENGILFKIMIFKEGRYIGDGVISDDYK